MMIWEGNIWDAWKKGEISIDYAKNEDSNHAAITEM